MIAMARNSQAPPADQATPWNVVEQRLKATRDAWIMALEAKLAAVREEATAELAKKIASLQRDLAEAQHREAERECLRRALEPIFVSPRESARLLGCGLRTFNREVSRGLPIAKLKIGGLVRYRLEELRAFVAAGCPEWTPED